MSPLVAGGKHRKDRPAPPLAKPFVDPSWGVVNADPFHVDMDKTPEHRAAYLADCGIWQDQFVEELARIARKRDRLDAKLRLPELADSPNRPDAVKKSVRMESDLIQRIRDLIMGEAEADRIWQSLTRQERGIANADFWWGTDASKPRLIGVTWFHMAKRYRWPPGFEIRRQWLSGLPMTVVMDLRIHRVYAWNPNPRPEFFPGTGNDPMPTDLARQIVNERGDPK